MEKPRYFFTGKATLVPLPPVHLRPTGPPEIKLEIEALNTLVQSMSQPSGLQHPFAFRTRLVLVSI